MSPFRLSAAALFLAALLPISGCGTPIWPSTTVDENARSAVYRVAVEQCGGADNQRATAIAVGPDLAATVAHSLEDAKTVTLQKPDGTSVDADIVYLDPGKDVAILHLSGPEGGGPAVEAVGFAEDEAEVGMAVTIATYADNDGPATKSGAISDIVVATLDGEGRRSAIKLEAEIEPGDSGAAVLIDGQLVGMVFATARSQNVGWAVAVSELSSAIDSLQTPTPEAVPGDC